MSQNDVAGFNNEMRYDNDCLESRQFMLLDK